MSECELCYKVIIREMSIFDWDAYCDVVEKEFNDIPRVCDTCAYRALFMYYHEKFKKENSDKDNGITIIQKNTDDEYHYYSICGQHMYRTYKKRDKMVSYPQGQVVLDVQTPNSIVHFNFLKEVGYIIPDPERPRHFRLGRNMTHQQLLELQDA